jgi:TonB family protein
MTIGIPDDMRRTAVVSLAGHLVALAVLFAVPLHKVPAHGTTTYQVSLVSTSVARPQSAKPVAKPIEREPIEKPAPAPPKAVVPERTRAVETPPEPSLPAPADQVPAVTPPPIALPEPQERVTAALTKRIQGIAQPKEITTTAPAEARPKPSRSVPDPPHPEPLISRPPSNVEDILKRADDALNRSVKVSPAKAPPSGALRATPKTSEEINTLLSKLPEPVLTPTTGKPTTPPEKVTAPPPKPAPPPMSEQIKEMLPTLSRVPPVETAPPKREPSPNAAVAASAPPATARAATLERCPQKAKKYCPLLEAAINRAWNADTNPGVRAVLESAGNSTATIRIVIQPDGKIQDIKVSQSSRNLAYDRAVLSVLGELRALPPLPEEMRGEPFVATTSFTYTKKNDS